jgi:hypothetical protein
MSRPSDDILEIECINFGFLSVKAGLVINKILNHSDLSEDEKLVLKRAQDFLLSVSQGAELVQTGVYQHNSNPGDSIKALNLAIDPLEKLQKIVQDVSIADYFKTMANSVEMFVTNPPAAVNQENRNLLENTEQFFEGLHKSLISTLSNRPKPSYEVGAFALI